MRGRIGTSAVSRLRLVLAAPNASRLRRLAESLRSEGFILSGIAASEHGAVAAAVKQRPDVFLLAGDLDGSPLKAAGHIAATLPRVKIVVVVDRIDEDECLAFLLAGVAGYLVDKGDGSAVASALRSAVAGVPIVPSAAQRRMIEELRA
jgi:two-component system, NarL family, response regulator LiaR